MALPECRALLLRASAPSLPPTTCSALVLARGRESVAAAAVELRTGAVVTAPRDRGEDRDDPPAIRRERHKGDIQ
jgi:hypothetical protein